MMMTVETVSDRNAEELQPPDPTGSLSVISSGYNTATSSLKSRWSHAEVRLSYTYTAWLSALHGVCYV